MSVNDVPNITRHKVDVPSIVYLRKKSTPTRGFLTAVFLIKWNYSTSLRIVTLVPSNRTISAFVERIK